jgi:voltage-gated sodium channel
LTRRGRGPDTCIPKSGGRDDGAAPGTSRVTDFARLLLAHPLVERAILVLIIVNAITLGLETSAGVRAVAEPWLAMFDRAVLAVFVAEIALRLLANRARFFLDPWSVFDFVVVGASLFPATGSLSVLRALRVLRVLRLITAVPSLRRVVAALVGALPGLGSIMLLLALLLYVFAVMATELYGAAFPEKFGTLGGSIYTLFQLMTLDGWSGEIVRPVMQVAPYSWVFFIGFIVATSFTLFNLFIGVVVSAMQSEHEREELAAAAASVTLPDIMEELRALRRELERIRAAEGGEQLLLPVRDTRT